MLSDDILFNVVEREVFSGVGHGDFRMFQAVEFFPGQIRRVVIAPVIEKKVVQKRAPGRGTVIKPEKLADPVRQVGHIVDMAINGGVVMEVILELPEFLMPQNIAHGLVIFRFERLPAVELLEDFFQDGLQKRTDLNPDAPVDVLVDVLVQVGEGFPQALERLQDILDFEAA